MLRSSPRTFLAWLILGAAAAGAFESLYLRMIPSAGRKQVRAALASIADEPGYREFLREVETRTEAGSTIVMVTPRPWGNGGYEYVYYRAVYLVAGRTVLPAIWNENQALLENVRSARYVAAWGMPVASPSHELVWQGSGGALYRRVEAPR